jgi:hypothetical protein
VIVICSGKPKPLRWNVISKFRSNKKPESAFTQKSHHNHNHNYYFPQSKHSFAPFLGLGEPTLKNRIESHYRSNLKSLNWSTIQLRRLTLLAGWVLLPFKLHPSRGTLGIHSYINSIPYLLNNRKWIALNFSMLIFVFILSSPTLFACFTLFLYMILSFSFCVINVHVSFSFNFILSQIYDLAHFSWSD